MKNKHKKKLKIKWKNILAIFLLIASFITLIISLYNIINWKLDSNNTNKQIEKINDIVEVESSQGEIIPQNEEIEESNPYWDYINMNLINVNFDDLKKENKDVAGWIQVNGTNINYPYVQTTDNEYYLTHSFDKSKNNAGWVYLDYRNNKDLSHKNNIIYAHGRYDGTMFGTLKKALTNGWLNDTNNYIIKLSTEKENTLWQVFSIYRIPTTSDYLQIDFSSNEEFIEFGEKLLYRSQHNFNTNISANDKILTLSTCYNDDEKVVLHAKLIKKATR